MTSSRLETYFRLPAPRREVSRGVSMREWQVHFEFAHALTFDRIDNLYDGPLLGVYASISGGDGYDTSGVTMTATWPTRSNPKRRKTTRTA